LSGLQLLKAQVVQLAPGLIGAALDLSITEIRRLDGVVHVHEPPDCGETRKSATATEESFQTASTHTFGAPAM